MPIICPGAPYMKLKTGAKVGIGEHIREVQKIFRPVFNATDVSGRRQRVRPSLQGRRTLPARRSLEVEVLHVPGHTPADIAYKVERRRLRRRHAVHARLRHRARRLSRRQRATLYRSISKLAVASARDAAVHVPRLQGARPRSLCVGDHGGRAARPATPHVKDGVDEEDIRRHARGARRKTPSAPAPAAVDPGQHPGRQAAAALRPTACAISRSP